MSIAAYVFIAIAFVAVSFALVILSTKYDELHDGVVALDLEDRIKQSGLLLSVAFLAILFAGLSG